MAAILDILIGSRNNTGPGFAGARSNLAALGTATDRSAARMQVLSDRVLFGQRRLQLLGRSLDEVTAKQGANSLAAQRASLVYDREAASIQRTERALDRLNNEAAQTRTRAGVAVLPRTLEQFGAGALGQLGVGLGVAALGQQIVDIGNKSADLAIKAQTIGTAYQQATAKAGVGAADLLSSLQDASRGTVSEANLQMSANKALGLGVATNIKDMSALLAIARQRGKDFGVSTEEAFQRIVEGIGKAEPEILDELGILLDANLAYKEYAKAHDVSTESLTKQQKVMILTNSVLAKNTDLVEKNKAAQTDLADQQAQNQARLQDAETRLGRAVAPIKIAALGAGAGILEGLTGITRENTKATQAALLTAATSYDDYVQRVRAKRQELYASGDLIGARAFPEVQQGQFGAARANALRALHDTTARSPETMQAYFAARAPMAATAMMAQSSGPYANTLSAPAREAPIYVTVQGSLVHTGDVADGITAAQQQKVARNGSAVRMGTGRRR